MLTCISHRLGCRYFIGEFINEQFLPERHGVIGGNSRRYFAPESLLTPDGRRVNWSWFINGNTKDNRATQSLPTEMSLSEDGIMQFSPIEELETLRYDKKTKKNIPIKKGSMVGLEEIQGNHLEIKLEMENTKDGNFGIEVLRMDEQERGLRITINRDRDLIEVGNENGDFTLREDEPLSFCLLYTSPSPRDS